MFLFTLQLTDLRILNLEGNALSSIPVEALSGLRSLAELRLSGNPLKVVGADAFSELRSLTRLDLSGCQLRVRKLSFFAFSILEHVLSLTNCFFVNAILIIAGPNLCNPTVANQTYVQQSNFANWPLVLNFANWPSRLRDCVKCSLLIDFFANTKWLRIRS